MKGRTPSRETIEKQKKTMREKYNRGYINNRKGVKLSEETKKKISIANKGNPSPMKGKKHSEEALAKMRKWSPSEEARKKISDKLKGVKLSEKTKKKISIALTGKVKPLETRKKLSIANKGQTPWNKGVARTEETRKKISKSSLGKKLSIETRQKIKEARKQQIFPVKDSTIEVKIQSFLKNLEITFTPHKYMGDIKYSYQCDIFIPTQDGISKKIVIECDGDYWHGNLGIIPITKLPQHRKAQRCLDYERTAQLEEAGFTVVRLPEHKIRKMNEDDFKERLLKC